jgi:hypothetical protein
MKFSHQEHAQARHRANEGVGHGVSRSVPAGDIIHLNGRRATSVGSAVPGPWTLGSGTLGQAAQLGMGVRHQTADLTGYRTGCLLDRYGMGGREHVVTP